MKVLKSKAQIEGNAELRLPAHHRKEIKGIADDVTNLDVTLGEKLVGVITSERSNNINLGVIRVVMALSVTSYRTKEVLAAEAEGGKVEGADWVAVSPNTTLRKLMKAYGDRLLGFDAKRDEFTIQLLSCDILDSEIRSVRVLIRNAV